MRSVEKGKAEVKVQNLDHVGLYKLIKDSEFYSKSNGKPKKNFKQKVTRLEFYF